MSQKKDENIRCLINIRKVLVDVSERTGSESMAFDEFSFAVFRDGLPETFQQSRWASYHVNAAATTSDEAGDAGSVKVVSWKSFSDAFLVVDFRVAEHSTGSSMNSTTGPTTRVHRKTNHQVRLTVCARNSSSGKSGTFTCPTGIDPSEAYNYPGGFLEYAFPLKTSDPTRSFPIGTGGLPRRIRCTVVALRDAAPALPLRTYHEQCVLVDQFILSVSSESQKGIVAYGFGYLTDISEGSAAKAMTRYTQDLLPPVPADDGNASVDFSQLQSKKTIDAMERNPVEFTIVSVDSKTYNNVTVGNRVISTSRFKTGEKGAAKSSLKAQLVLCLIRQDAAGNRSLEVNEDHSMDLAGEILNIESLPSEGIVRKTTFSYGEVLYYRIRRRCFVDAEVYGDKLLSEDPSSPVRGQAASGSGTVAVAVGHTLANLPAPSLPRTETHDEVAPRPLYSPTV